MPATIFALFKSQEYFDKFVEKLNYAISSSVVESVIAEDNIVDYNLGIGTLRLLVADNKIKYKFVPSEILEESLINAVQKEHTNLKSELESSLANKILKQYKELL